MHSASAVEAGLLLGRLADEGTENCNPDSLKASIVALMSRWATSGVVLSWARPTLTFKLERSKTWLKSSRAPLIGAD
eukprot:14771137-Alexandrium_andersonii.AAC.1